MNSAIGQHTYKSDLKEWEINTPDLDIKGPINYQFKLSKDIQLSFIPFDSEAYESIQKSGGVMFAKNYISGKNKIYELLGYDTISNVKVSISGGSNTVINLEYSHNLENTQYNYHDRIYINLKHQILIQLKWQVEVDKILLDKAKKSFEELNHHG